MRPRIRGSSIRNKHRTAAEIVPHGRCRRSHTGHGIGRRRRNRCVRLRRWIERRFRCDLRRRRRLFRRSGSGRSLDCSGIRWRGPRIRGCRRCYGSDGVSGRPAFDGWRSDGATRPWYPSHGRIDPRCCSQSGRGRWSWHRNLRTGSINHFRTSDLAQTIGPGDAGGFVRQLAHGYFVNGRVRGRFNPPAIDAAVDDAII
jgi:hypothetical protein